MLRPLGIVKREINDQDDADAETYGVPDTKKQKRGSSDAGGISIGGKTIGSMKNVTIAMMAATTINPIVDFCKRYT